MRAGEEGYLGKDKSTQIISKHIKDIEMVSTRTSSMFCTLATAKHPVATAGWAGPWVLSRISWERTR